MPRTTLVLPTSTTRRLDIANRVTEVRKAAGVRRIALAHRSRCPVPREPFSRLREKVPEGRMRAATKRKETKADGGHHPALRATPSAPLRSARSRSGQALSRKRALTDAGGACRDFVPYLCPVPRRFVRKNKMGASLADPHLASYWALGTGHRALGTFSSVASFSDEGEVPTSRSARPH